jgi:hypothetical protein
VAYCWFINYYGATEVPVDEFVGFVRLLEVEEEDVEFK